MWQRKYCGGITCEDVLIFCPAACVLATFRSCNEEYVFCKPCRCVFCAQCEVLDCSRAATSWYLRGGQSHCNLLYLTTKHVIQNIGGSNFPVAPLWLRPGCSMRVAAAWAAIEKNPSNRTCQVFESSLFLDSTCQRRKHCTSSGTLQWSVCLLITKEKNSQAAAKRLIWQFRPVSFGETESTSLADSSSSTKDVPSYGFGT